MWDPISGNVMANEGDQIKVCDYLLIIVHLVPGL